MKILHTADWHLGKRLDHIPRLDEQREVLDEICEIAEKEEVHAVLLAGDLFDNVNPSIEALELFYKILKRLADNGKRAVIGIAGNHDSPDRIEAPDPLARECGIILAGHPDTQERPFALESGLSILQSDQGFLEIQLPGTPEPLRLIHTAYANQFRLKKFLSPDNEEAELRQVLQEGWHKLAGQYCDDKGVNILMTHLFFMKKGGKHPEESDDEKTILTVGGAQEVYTENLPSHIQYVALGHLHRGQLITDDPCPVVYSGSPLAYSMSEAGQPKSVTIIEVEAGKEAEWRRVPLIRGKQLARRTFDDLDKAVQWLESEPDCLVELTFISDHYLSAAERKRLYDAHNGIVTIIPQITNPDLQELPISQIDINKDMESLFIDYFKHKHTQAPNKRILNLFREVLAEDGPDDSG